MSAVRTPVGKFGRAFRDIPAQTLGSIVIGEAVKRAGVPPEGVDEVIMGNAVMAGLGQNPARQAARAAGLPDEIGSFTVNKVCGSGLKSVMLAAQAVLAGDADLVAAGGMENMSLAPHLIRGLRWGVKFGDSPVTDALIFDGLWDAYNGYHMGMTGERVAGKYAIGREEADEFSLQSHQKALEAVKNNWFREEIIPVEREGRVVERDEGVREDTSIEKLSRLPSIFKRNGILTAGNSSQLSDGAAAVMVASGEKARELGASPIARIAGYFTSGTRPEDVMEAPIPAVRGLLKKTGLRLDEIDLIEHNEAYSTATIAVERALGIDPARLNVNGGAVALGHPIGCSGARILVTLVYALKNRSLKRGLATLCLGGGNAVAMIVEMC